MTDKTSNNFAIEWSEDIVDWVIEAADEDDIEPEVAVFASLAAGVVLALIFDFLLRMLRSQRWCGVGGASAP